MEREAGMLRKVARGILGLLRFLIEIAGGYSLDPSDEELREGLRAAAGGPDETA